MNGAGQQSLWYEAHASSKVSEQFPPFTELERVDEELHVLSLNYHASTATAQIQHNGPQYKQGIIQQACEVSFLWKREKKYSQIKYFSMCGAQETGEENNHIFLLVRVDVFTYL